MRQISARERLERFAFILPPVKISTGIRWPSGTSLNPIGRKIEKRPAGERQCAHKPGSPKRIMDHGRASARRMVADLVLGFEHEHAAHGLG